MKNFLFLLFLLILFFPLISLAGTYKASIVNEQTGQTATYTVTYEGLVPCGKKVKVDGILKYIPCQFCHFFVMFKGVVDFVLFKIVPPLAILLIVMGGIMFLLPLEDLIENPKYIETGKSLLTSVFIGLLIIFSAWLLINLLFQVIGVADWTGLKGGWWQINCPIKISF